MVRTQTASRNFSFRQSAAVQAGSSQAGGVFSVSAPGCTITPCPTARYCASDATARDGASRLASRNSSAVGMAFKLASLRAPKSEEHTSELQSLMRISYAVFCLKKKNQTITIYI